MMLLTGLTIIKHELVTGKTRITILNIDLTTFKRWVFLIKAHPVI